MKKIQLRLQKLFGRKITLMVVPHSILRPIQMHFSVSFLTSVFFCWTGLTCWAAWAVIGNLDYWTTKADHQVLKLKVRYFSNELKKSRELVDQVREADSQLRKLLEMKNRQAIIAAESGGAGQGGAEAFERAILQKELTNRSWEITAQEFRQVSEAVQLESRARLGSYKEISEHIAYERGLNRSTPRGWPAQGRTTSHFGPRISPMHGGPQFHTGIDIAGDRGSQVRATADGTVQHSDWEGGYGRLVVIDHGFGYVTYYGHNSKLFVKVGERVKRGQAVAAMGSSGSATGDHTHYEILLNGKPINPWKYLAAHAAQDLKSKR